MDSLKIFDLKTGVLAIGLLFECSRLQSDSERSLGYYKLFEFLLFYSTLHKLSVVSLNSRIIFAKLSLFFDSLLLGTLLQASIDLLEAICLVRLRAEGPSGIKPSARKSFVWRKGTVLKWGGTGLGGFSPCSNTLVVRPVIMCFAQRPPSW